LLRASDEPSPRVWNALESQLRREGIIHAAGVPQRSSVWHESLMRWRMAWLVPVAAAMIIAVGIKLYHPRAAGDKEIVARQVAPTPPVQTASAPATPILTGVAAAPGAPRASHAPA